MLGRTSLLCLSLGSLTGCPNTDAAVFVDPSVEGANATLQMSALSAAIEGSLTLKLHLGPRASDESLVELQQLSVQNADRSTTIHAPLQVTTDPTFPVAVPIDSDVAVAIAFTADDNLLETTAVDALCDPAGIVIAGTMDDSLRGASVPFGSGPFQVQSCP